MEYEPGEDGLALCFGPNTRHMPLIAHGSFRVVTISCAPRVEALARIGADEPLPLRYPSAEPVRTPG